MHGGMQIVPDSESLDGIAYDVGVAHCMRVFEYIIDYVLIG